MTPTKRVLPELVKKLCFEFDAWIVGSWVVTDCAKDIDVIVPPEKWRNVLAMLSGQPFHFTSLGGLRVELSGQLPVEIWPDTLENFLSRLPRGKVGRIWQPRTGLILLEDQSPPEVVQRTISSH